MIEIVAIIIMVINIMIGGILLAETAITLPGLAIIITIIIFVLVIPEIIVICLSDMIKDFMYNVEQQSKMLSNIEYSTKSLLDSLKSNEKQSNKEQNNKEQIQKE